MLFLALSFVLLVRILHACVSGNNVAFVYINVLIIDTLLFGRVGMGSTLRGRHEKLAALVAGVSRRLDRVTYRSLGREDLKIVTAFICLVPEKVDGRKVLVKELKAVGFVPAAREDVEGNLATDRKSQIQVSKLLLQRCDHGFTDTCFEIVFLEGITLLLTAVPTDGGHVEHPVPEFDEGPSFHRDLEVRNVVQDKIDETLQLGFPHVGLKTLDGQQLLSLVCDQPVLGEHVVVALMDVLPDLLLDFNEIGPPHDAHSDMLHVH